MDSPNAERNELIEKWRREHRDKYIAPVMERVIVGASGITPDRKGIDETGVEQVGDLIDEKRPIASDEEFGDMMGDVWDNDPNVNLKIATDSEFNEMMTKVWEEDESAASASEQAAVDAVLNNPELAKQAAKLLINSGLTRGQAHA